MSLDNSALPALALRIQERMDSVIATLTTLAKDTQHLCANATRSHQRPSRADLSHLGDELRGGLALADRVVDGIGVATVPGYLSDSEFWLEWWRIDAQNGFEFVNHSLNPQHDGFYDYGARPWFTAPIRSKSAMVTGPYVDAGGTNTYTITAAVPIDLNGRVIGVAGGDIHVSYFESLLAGSSSLHKPVLLNADRRVIASASSDYIPGELVPETLVMDAPSWKISIGSSSGAGWELLDLS
jgi:hypothetical protein